MTPVFDVELKPKDPNASIVHILVRVYDPLNIDTHDKCLDFVEKQFPMYQVEHVLRGYRE